MILLSYGYVLVTLVTLSHLSQSLEIVGDTYSECDQCDRVTSSEKLPPISARYVIDHGSH